MTLAITGWSVLCSAGVGADAFTAVVPSDDAGLAACPDVRGMYDEPLPGCMGHALVGLDARQVLGRKGTSTLDRRTVLTLIACRDALADGGVHIDDRNRHRIGVTLGTTWGSLKAMSDYTKESLLEDPPYLVEPARFPNTVMNCAAGQVAIWNGLKGVNATIAGGDLAFLNVLEYTDNVLRCGYSDRILAGAVEEFTPHTAWASHLMRGGQTRAAAGEAAAMFVIERADAARAGLRRVDAEVLAVSTGFVPGGRARGQLSDGLARCVRRALAQAGVDPADVACVAATASRGDADEVVERNALDAVFTVRQPLRIAPRARFGDCHAAIGALQSAAVLALHRRGALADGEMSIVTNWTDDGGVGAAVLKGWSRAGAHRG